MVINNLCPVCEAKRAAGEDISSFTERLKINVTPGSKTDVILVCIHEGSCSILDIGTCTTCQKRGFLVPPEDQVGIYTSRELVDQLEISLDSTDRGFYCKEHGADQECEVCGKKVRQLSNITTNDWTKKLCGSCASAYRPCKCCGKYTEYNALLAAWLCPVCAPTYARCDCGSLMSTTSIVQWDEHTKACPACTYTTECSWCNVRQLTKNNSSETYLCKTHWHMFKDVPQIEGYHHTRPSVFYREQNEGKTKCFLGIEWEAQLNITAKKFPARTLQLRKRLFAGKVKAIFPDAECKRDGSLYVNWNRQRHENGLEVVWQPMSFAYIHRHRDKFKEMFKVTKSQLHRFMNESGMHIHISKAAFTAFHFLKFTNFFYTSDKAGFLAYIAGRTGNSYAKTRSSYSADGKVYGVKATGSRAALYFQQQQGKTLKIQRERSFNPDRYDILNITNSATFEVRAFKSPHTYDAFMANIEYVYAMYLYTKDVSQNEMSLTDFFKFVANNVSKFPELHKRTLTYKGDM